MTAAHTPQSRGDPVIDRALRALVPASVRVGSRLIDARDIAALHDDERAIVARAVEKRQREFATGRALLRELMGRDVPVGVATSRAPILPDGWRGSLAHDDRLAVAAITSDPAFSAVGIDIEPTTTLSNPMADVILRPDESGLDAHLAFTLKEAAYKAWSVLGGAILDHHDMRLEVQAPTFTATVMQTGTQLDGRFQTVRDRTVAVVLTRRDQRPVMQS